MSAFEMGFSYDISLNSRIIIKLGSENRNHDRKLLENVQTVYLKSKLSNVNWYTLASNKNLWIWSNKICECLLGLFAQHIDDNAYFT